MVVPAVTMLAMRQDVMGPPVGAIFEMVIVAVGNAVRPHGELGVLTVE